MYYSVQYQTLTLKKIKIPRVDAHGYCFDVFYLLLSFFISRFNFFITLLPDVTFHYFICCFCCTYYFSIFRFFDFFLYFFLYFFLSLFLVFFFYNEKSTSSPVHIIQAELILDCVSSFSILFFYRVSHLSESVSFWLGAGADPNGLSSDQQSTALTAAISHRRRDVIKVCHKNKNKNKNKFVTYPYSSTCMYVIATETIPNTNDAAPAKSAVAFSSTSTSTSTRIKNKTRTIVVSIHVRVYEQKRYKWCCSDKERGCIITTTISSCCNGRVCREKMTKKNEKQKSFQREKMFFRSTWNTIHPGEGVVSHIRSASYVKKKESASVSFLLLLLLAFL